MIRILIWLPLFFFSTFKSNAQEAISKKEASATYIKETISFLNAIKQDELNDSTFTLINTPKFFCFDSVIQDSITFTVDELRQIVREIKSPKIKKWDSILPLKGQLLKQKRVNALLKNVKADEELASYKKYFGGAFHNFSAPIFLKNYTVCLFYADQMNAEGKSSGELLIYEKTDGIWKQIMKPCEWVE